MDPVAPRAEDQSGRPPAYNVIRAGYNRSLAGLKGPPYRYKRNRLTTSYREVTQITKTRKQQTFYIV
jgi:hypothetical protein